MARHPSIAEELDDRDLERLFNPHVYLGMVQTFVDLLCVSILRQVIGIRLPDRNVRRPDIICAS